MSIVATGIGAVIAGIATKVGAGLVKEAVAGKLGGTAGDLAGIVVDKIAGKLGLPVDQIDEKTHGIEAAVREVEADMPAILAQYLEQQREQNRLMLAEMDKSESVWTWAWRPAGMWIMLIGVVWYVALVPLINMVASWAGLTARLELIVEIGTFATLFMFFSGFYMGGHTVKDAASKLTAAFGKKGAA